MVSIAPNEFRINGEVLSKKKDESLENFMTVSIRLDKVEHLNGPEDFLDATENEIAVSMKDSVAAGLQKGMKIQCNIRKAPGQFFVIPGSIDTGEEER